MQMLACTYLPRMFLPRHYQLRNTSIVMQSALHMQTVASIHRHATIVIIISLFFIINRKNIYLCITVLSTVIDNMMSTMQAVLQSQGELQLEPSSP